MDGQESPNAGTPAHCVRLFGVKLTDFSTPQHASIQMGFLRKSVSTGNLALKGFNTLQRHADCAQPQTEYGSSANPRSDITAAQQGYASDGLMQNSLIRERKKGVPWTEDEHRLFLAGLQKLGKGDWRGISRNFVTSRTPTQVASHAQKYFLRQGNLNQRKRRSSLFDIINSQMVPGAIVIGDDSQGFRATDIVRPPLELGVQQVPASSSSFRNNVSGYSKLPSSRTPCVSADLCLGRSHSQQWHELVDQNVSAVLSQSGKQASMMDAMLHYRLTSSRKALSPHVDVVGTDYRSKSLCTISSSSSSSRSISSGSSLCRIDETSELSSLSLSLGPPMSVEGPELALKLEQPVTSRLSAPSARSEMKEVMLMAGASKVVGNASKVASMGSVIKVV